MIDLKRTTVLGVCVVLLLAAGCGSSPSTSSPPTKMYNKPDDPDAIRKLMRPDSIAPAQEGIAAAILLDTSGSMQDPVQGADKTSVPKLQVAKKALLNLLRQFGDFARKHPDQKILVGIYDFSARKGQPPCRQVIKLGPPDVKTAENAINGMIPAGSTPIGDAMITAKRDLDATGLSHRHILVVSDGENNMGYLPGDVAKAIEKGPEPERAAIYFIAFDIGADLFEPVRQAGGLVLAAESEQQLTDTLDFILTGKILVEQPPPAAQPPHPPIPGTRKK